MPPRRPTRASPGFTLVDLLLVLAILALAAAAVIRRPATAAIELDSAARGVVADLVEAQGLALETRTAFGLRIDPVTERTHFVLGDGTRPGTVAASLRTGGALSGVEVDRLVAARSRGEDGWPGVHVHSAAFGGTTRVVFEPDGSVRDGGVAELRAAGTWLRVRVQAGTGRIAITAP